MGYFGMKQEEDYEEEGFSLASYLYSAPHLLSTATLLIILGLLVYGSGCNVAFKWQYRLPPGTIVPESPHQTSITGKSWVKDGIRFTALAKYSIRARVIVTGRHFSDLSPVDLTLGWGPASNTAVLKRFRFVHSYRHVFWNGDGTIDPYAISSYVANLHAIPSGQWVRKKLLSLGTDDIVTLDGYLVAVEGESPFWGSWEWISSLSRDDSGDGACEVMWIEDVRFDGA